ncbi:MAG: filamentous hemagglutinin N-terminal domain-containing protein [Cyanobacteria bacterium J06621_8]
MPQALLSPLRTVFCALGFSLANSSLVLAQVTPDNTVNTQVTQNGNVAEITGGETQGANLFHSFQDFSVPTGNEAFFNNANDIGNIFSRVTGGNISSIDGLIRANGSANLFLINPAGIMFGENASLSIGGSFFGSTASSILFEGGEFSAVDLDNPPLLTVNAPIGLSFRDNPGNIVANQATLVVPDGETLALLGGNLNFDGGTYIASNGRVDLGGLMESGTININNDGGFDFPEAVTRGNITAAGAIFSAAGEESGSVTINARNLALTSGSRIFNGILSGSGIADNQAGDVVINLTEDLTIANNSDIINSIFQGSGNSGDVIVNARNVNFNDGGIIFIFNNGAGNIGDTTLTATEDINFDGISGSQSSGISYFVTAEASGDIGSINIAAQNLEITNGGSITSTVEANSDSGDINLNIIETIRIDGSGFSTFPDGSLRGELSSRINTIVANNGNVGDININTQNLFLSNNGEIDASIFGTGNSGNININADLITISEPGSPNLPAASISASAFDSENDNSDSVANGGNITINTGSLRINDGGNIQAAINGRGNGGNIKINARDEVSVSGAGLLETASGEEITRLSGIFVDVNPLSSGEAGNIEIETSSLFVDQGFISADVLGEGNGGSINILATDSITLANAGLIQAAVFQGSTGNGGDITIETPQLTLTEESLIGASILGEGNGGSINILAADSITLANASFILATVFEGATGNGGDIIIETPQLTLTEGSQVDASIFGEGNAGSVTINASESVSLSGTLENSRGGIFASALIEDGNSGDINLTTGELTISDGAIITASNFSSLGVENGGSAPGTGEPGNISITADTLNLASEGRIEAITQAETGDGANINLEIADTIFLSGDSFISAQAFGNADGGNINIDTDFIVAVEGNNDIIASAEQGQGGNINISAESLLGIRAGTLNPFTSDINASSEFGLDGSVALDVPDIASLQGEAELLTNILEPDTATAQACNDRDRIVANNSLVISGQGGVPDAPDMPLNSENIIVDGDIASSDLPQSIETSKGNILPARGIKVSDKGEIILTSYPTNNQGDRLPQIANSCS